MRRRRTAKAFEVVAAFENRDDTAFRVLSGDLHQPRGRPGKILFAKIEAAQRIAAMRELNGSASAMPVPCRKRRREIGRRVAIKGP